jgi:preprotein translocase subunit YajC
MVLNTLNLLMAMGSAQTSGSTTPPTAGQLAMQFMPLVLLIVIFYFLLIRPQQLQAKKHAELLKNVQPGDKVLASGGIIGVVITVKEKFVTIRSADSKLEIAKSAIGEVIEKSGQSSEN